MAEFDLSVFYRDVLKGLILTQAISTKDKILVVCGGPFDKQVLLSLNFSDVTITNLDERQKKDAGSEFSPYRWDFQDLEKLEYSDESFDVVIVHSGLHHLRCPQRGINEMYRVAKRAVIGFEPHRNLYTTLGVKLGAGQEYEDAAVFYNDCLWGGVANTNIPNYVVRFNRGDIERTVQIYNPVARHKIEFFYATRIPSRLEGLASGTIVGRAIALFTGLLATLGTMPPFANNIAFCIYKPQIPADLFPWLMEENNVITCNKTWLAKKYRSPEKTSAEV